MNAPTGHMFLAQGFPASISVSTGLAFQVAGQMAASSKTPKCKSCQQTFGMFDKDLLPKTEPLKWHRYGKDPHTGQRSIPEGEECYECAQVRMRSMGGMTLEELCKLRSSHADPALFVYLLSELRTTSLHCSTLTSFYTIIYDIDLNQKL